MKIGTFILVFISGLRLIFCKFANGCPPFLVANRQVPHLEYLIKDYCSYTRRDKSLFKTWSEIRYSTRAAVAVAAAAAIATASAQQREADVLYQNVTAKLESGPGNEKSPGVPGNDRTSG